MSNQIPQQPATEEVDLGQLFKAIGRAIKTVFDFIASIFKYLFELLILGLIFLKKHILKFAIAGVLGLVLGAVLDHFKKPYFTSSMLVQPNFDVNSQLIQNINLFDQLVEAKDSITLSNMLNIKSEEASKIKAVNIEPLDNANETLELFEDYIKNSDTLKLQNLTLEKFEDNLQDSDYRQYNITIETYNRDVFKKVENKLIYLPISNYTKSLQDTELNIFNSRIANIKSMVKDLDSLKSSYKTAMLNASVQNAGQSASNIYLASEKDSKVKEIEIFELEHKYNNELQYLELEKTKKTNIINVISGFQSIGIQTKDSNKLKFILGFLGLTLLGLLLLELNKFLTRQEQKLNA